jgi:hypothetical protein
MKIRGLGLPGWHDSYTGADRMYPTDDAILMKAELRTVRDIELLQLTVEDGGKQFVGNLKNDPELLKKTLIVLTANIGRPLKEIFDLEITP